MKLFIILSFISLQSFGQNDQQANFWALQGAWQIPASESIVAWYKSDAGVTGTTTVTAWADQSGNGNTLVNQTGTEPSLALNQINGFPAIQFTSGKRLINSTFSRSQPYTICVVGKLTNTAINNGFFDSYNNVQAFVYAPSGSTGWHFAAGTDIATSVTTLNTNFNVIVATGNGTSSDVFVNPTGANLNRNAGTNAISGISIGEIRGNPTVLSTAYSLAGYIAEIVVFSRSLSSKEYGQLYNYFKTKYAL